MTKWLAPLLVSMVFCLLAVAVGFPWKQAVLLAIFAAYVQRGFDDAATAANGLPVRIGERNNASDELTGVMAFAEVYNCVLTLSQVSTYNGLGPRIY